jgi:Phage tail tube protein
MARKTLNTAILAKLETTYGADALPTGAANALLISEASFDLSYNNVDRNNIKGYFGSDEQLAGTRFVEMSFSVEISGSGAAGTAPAYGPLLRACAMAEAITVGSRVEYNPVSTSLESVTIYYHDDGVQHTALGCMGNVQLAMGEGERPLLKFNFTGLDGGIAATANPALTLTAWKAPLVITDANSGDIKLGSAYAAGVISGGTAYPSRGLSLDLGNQVAKVALLGGQAADITDRKTTGSMQLELTAAQEVAFYGDVNANALTTMSFEHGTTAGAKVAFFMPSVQRANPKHAEYEGRVHHTFDLRVLPVSGNDELRIVVL